MAEAGWQVPGLVPISVPSPSQEPHPHSGSFAIAGDQEGWNRGGGVRPWGSCSGVVPVCPQASQGGGWERHLVPPCFPTGRDAGMARKAPEPVTPPWHSRHVPV